jgi:hypothetical protein
VAREGGRRIDVQLKDARLAFERFTAREILLDTVREQTDAWAVLRRFCAEVDHRPDPGSHEEEDPHLYIERQWKVGSQWAEVCGINVEWVTRWVCPVIPPRWVMPWITPTHYESLKLGTLFLYQVPPWAPSAVCDAWGYEKSLIERISGSEEQVYEEVQFRSGGGYFDERRAFTRGLTDETDAPLWSWMPDELPPNPLAGESQRQFLARMKTVWQRRLTFIREAGLDSSSPLRDFVRPAAWFVHFQVLRWDYRRVWERFDEVEDLSTIKKAIKKFSELVGIPLRPLPPARHKFFKSNRLLNELAIPTFPR